MLATYALYPQKTSQVTIRILIITYIVCFNLVYKRSTWDWTHACPSHIYPFIPIIWGSIAMSRKKYIKGNYTPFPWALVKLHSTPNLKGKKYFPPLTSNWIGPPFSKVHVLLYLCGLDLIVAYFGPQHISRKRNVIIKSRYQNKWINKILEKRQNESISINVDKYKYLV